MTTIQDAPRGQQQTSPTSRSTSAPSSGAGRIPARTIPCRAPGRDRRAERARLPDGQHPAFRETTDFGAFGGLLAGPRPSFVNDAPWRIDVEPAQADWDAPHHRETLAA
jgi:hypothetical protein